MNNQFSSQISKLANRINKVLEIQESVYNRTQSIISKDKNKLKILLNELKDVPEEEFILKLSPFMTGIYNHVRQGSFGIKDISKPYSRVSKTLLLGDLIENEFNNLKKCEGKYANLRIIPYYGEYDYKPETKSIEARIIEVKELDKNSGRPRIYFKENNTISNESLMNILFAKRESQDTDGGLYKINILGEDTEFPSKNLVKSTDNLEYVLYKLKKGEL